MSPAKNDDELVAEIITWIQQDRIQEQLEPLDIDANTALIEAEIFDSLKILQFVSWLESHYQITVGIEHLTAELFASPAHIAKQVQLFLTQK